MAGAGWCVVSGYDEAVAWFRADRGRLRDLDDVDNRSAAIAIVRALLAAPPAVPAGRDLTAQDVRDALSQRVALGAGEQRVAEFLNRIARPSGGVGHPVGVSEAQPDSDDPPPPHCLRCADGLTTGYLESERDFLREELEKAAAEIDRLRAGSLPAPPPDTALVTELCDELGVERDELIDTVNQNRVIVMAFDQCVDEEVARRTADRSPRSWSSPAPPPDDVTVEYRVRHLQREDSVMSDDAANLPEMKRMYRVALAQGEAVAESRTVSPWQELPVVEGEPPAPEPQEPPRFERGDQVQIKGESAVVVAAFEHDVYTVARHRDGAVLATPGHALAAAGAERAEEES